MSEVTVSIHNHHERLLRNLREQSAAFVAEPSADNGARLLTLLREDLLPHAEGEERALYPLIDRILRTARNGRATETMSVDHEFITEYVDWIGAALHSLPESSGMQRDLLLSQLRRYLVQLEAVLNLHLEKEERIFLPMIERHLSLAEQQRMMAAMHGTPGAAGADTGARLRRILPRAAGKQAVARNKGGRRAAPGRNRRPRR